MELDKTVFDFRYRRTLFSGMASVSSTSNNSLLLRLLVANELCNFYTTRCLRGLQLMHLPLRFRCRKHLLFPLESPPFTPINHKFMCKTDNYNCLQCSNVNIGKRLILLHLFYISDLFIPSNKFSSVTVGEIDFVKTSSVDVTPVFT